MVSWARIGIIGCGVIGQTHRQTFGNCPGAEPVALADANPANLSAAAGLPDVKTFTDGHELIRSGVVDVQWLVGMPTRVTAEIGLGKHHDMEVEDSVSALLRFENGATRTSDVKRVVRRSTSFTDVRVAATRCNLRPRMCCMRSAVVRDRIAIC